MLRAGDAGAREKIFKGVTANVRSPKIFGREK
jgi:hypothetical protein